MAKVMVRATASGGIAILAIMSRIWALTSEFDMGSAKSVRTKPGETTVTRRLSPASCRRPSEIRNFPTREALIEAAYRNEVARLCDSVPGLLAAMPPGEALRAWTRRFIDYATAKLGMADALRAVVASGTNPYAESHDMIQAALSSLMDAAAATGEIRSGIRSTDMFAALAGIALTSAKLEQREQAERILDLTLDGLRPVSRG